MPLGKLNSGFSKISLESNSASQTEAARKIQILEQENFRLKQELSEVKGLYVQLTREGGHEKFDERRVQMLKAQLVQLERQLLLLNDALGARMCVVLEAENALQSIADRCRSCQSQDGRIGGNFVSKEDLLFVIETAESARLKLYKNLENTTMQRLHKPVQFLDRFLKSNSAGNSTDVGDVAKPTLLDVCSGELSHLNLKQIGKLESRLSHVYSQLQKVNLCLTAHLFPNAEDSAPNGCSFAVPQANVVRLLGESSRACNLLNDILPDLLELSVLVPAAPWPMLKKPLVKELTLDHVMSRMPSMTKSRTQDVATIVDSLLKVLSLQQLKANSQEKSYREEIQFHRSVYDLQIKYIDDLFKALRVAYEQFESETNELICEPLQKVLNIYQSLKKTASEDALRKFLAVFKEIEPQMMNAVEKLKKEEAFKGQDEALSGFAQDFFTKLELLQKRCEEKRDLLIEDLDDVKAQQAEYWNEIKRLMRGDLEPGKDEQDEMEVPMTPVLTNRTARNKAKSQGARPGCDWNSCTSINHDEPLPLDERQDTERLSLARSSSFPTSSRVPDIKQEPAKTKRRSSQKKPPTPLQDISPPKPNIKDESEALFRSMLRGGIDEGPGFVFNSTDSFNEQDPDCLEHKPEKKSSRERRREQRASSGPSPVPGTGKLMKGVPRSKLTLNPIAALSVAKQPSFAVKSDDGSSGDE